MAASLNRRQFLKAAAAAAVTGPFIGSSGAASPNQRVRLAFIACGERAQQMLPMFLSAANTEIAALCDVNEPRMGLLRDAIQQLKPEQKPDMVIDYRSILDRKDVDGVVIATTQHWHGLPHIHAAQAGKAIFVEKPLSHTVVEGRAMVQASKKYGVHTIMGTQQRIGPSYQQAVEVVRSGRLGKISLVECWNYHNTGQRAEPIERVRAVPYFDPKDPMRSEQDGPFQRLFVDSIREGKPPMIDIEHSHKATVCCHLANIAYLTRSTVHWDGATETIANNPAASALLARPRRRGYELPSV